MALSTQPYKGARDFYPEDERLQKYIFGKWREVCERFGYEEYDAPILEPTELYLSKGSDEIIQGQTFTFADRSDRSVTLRTEMTPTVSRMVAARRQELAYPLRWYSIPQCWRYERMQRGRGREFYQLNVDIFGVEGLAADFETIQIADEIMQAFGAKREMYTIKVNSRKLMDSLLSELLGFDQTQAETLGRLIDRMHKIEHGEFLAQLEGICSPSQREAGVSERLQSFLKTTSLADLPPELQTNPSVHELVKLIVQLQTVGISNVVFDPTLMRGFDYYTDIAFEVFDTDQENNRSLFGGGRYDDLQSLFGAEPLPSVGFGMGDITLKNFLETHKLIPAMRPEADLYVVLVGDLFNQLQTVLTELREMGVNVVVDSTNRKPDKQIKTAVKKGIRYVLFIGENELESEQFVLKDIVTGVEEKHGLQRIVTTVKDFRHS